MLNKIMVNMKENVEVINNPLLPTITKYHVIKNINEINKFANKNNYQIRAPFIEIKNNDYYDIYIETYDLTKSDKVSELHNKSLEKRLKNKKIIKPNSDYIGKWQLIGEITEPDRYFNPKEEHYMPNIKYNYIEIYKNTKTNYDELRCIDKYLINKSGDKVFLSYLNKTKYNDIITINMNTEDSNSRPY